jgi:hypothetical protein
VAKVVVGTVLVGEVRVAEVVQAVAIGRGRIVTCAPCQEACDHMERTSTQASKCADVMRTSARFTRHPQRSAALRATADGVSAVGLSSILP